jgi:transcriptional regulator MraZ
MPGPLLLGEYEFTLDAKNRIAVPARFRPVFAEGIFVTRGFDRCLSVYSPAEWERFVDERTGDLSEMSRKGRQVRRFVFAGATAERLDGQGRVKLSQSLLEFAGITKDVTIIGVYDHLEVWDRASWADYRQRMEEGADASADELTVP